MSSTAPAPRYYPKEIGNILYDPGKSLIGFHVIIDGKLVSHAQVHAKLIEKISKYAGTIRFIKIYSFLHSDDIALVFFLDTTGKKVNPYVILADLQSVPVFKSAQLIKPIKEGLIFDTYSFPPLYAGEKAIIFRKFPSSNVEPRNGRHKRSRNRMHSNRQPILPVPHNQKNQENAVNNLQ